MKTYQVNKEGYYGEFGGAYIPEILHRCVEELQNAYSKVLESEGFKQEFHQLLRDYVGRPSPLYLANRLSKKEIFEGGYLKPGEQYLQLRYLPGEVK